MRLDQLCSTIFLSSFFLLPGLAYSQPTVIDFDEFVDNPSTGGEITGNEFSSLGITFSTPDLLLNIVDHTGSGFGSEPNGLSVITNDGVRDLNIQFDVGVGVSDLRFIGDNASGTFVASAYDVDGILLSTFGPTPDPIFEVNLSGFAVNRVEITGLVWIDDVRFTVADPTIYSFSADTVTFGNEPTLASLLTGLPPEGSFVYDSSVAQTGTTPPSAFDAGAAIYFGSVTSFEGTVNGMGFSEPIARTRVGNQRYLFPGQATLTDVLTVQGGSGLGSNFVGFDIGGYRLDRVLLSWIEGNPGIGDFLADESLPTDLPSFEGLLTLRFALITDPNVFAVVNFVGLRVFPDQDKDAVADSIDNCPTVFNPNQFDVDRDGIGNLCDDNGSPVDLLPGRPENPGPPIGIPPVRNR